MAHNKVISALVEASKIAVALIMVSKIEPLLNEIIPVDWLAYGLSVIISALSVALILTILIPRPSLTVEWRENFTGHAVAGPTITWDGERQYYYYDLALRIHAASPVARLVMAILGSKLQVNIAVGLDETVVPNLENQRSDVAVERGALVLKPRQTNVNEYAATASVSYRLPEGAVTSLDSRQVIVQCWTSSKQRTVCFSVTSNVDRVFFRRRSRVSAD